MKSHEDQTRVHLQQRTSNRRGAILVLAAFLMVVILAFTAFTVDIGYIVVTKSQLQNAADASALAAVAELPDGWGPGANYETSQTEWIARSVAGSAASDNPAGGSDSVYLNTQRDVRLGQLTWNPATGSWDKLWGVAPYNLIETRTRRDQGSSSAGDGSLNLFFAPVIGHETADVTAISMAAMLPVSSFKITPGSDVNVGILPITLDVDTWDAMLAGAGDDDFYWDESTKTISSGSDGILEVNLYPNGTTLLPPGNRGTVDFGSSGNSTADIARQILYGLNESDMSYFGGELNYDQLPMILNGDTGLSAGIKDELDAVKGEPRIIPLFSTVSGPGNNANYTIVRFVGIRILDVKLTGNPNQKHVTVQPAPVIAPTGVAGEGTITFDTIFAPPTLIQ